MKNTSLSVCVILLTGFAIYSCGNSSQEKDAEGFPAAASLAADSIAIDEILEVNGIALCKDYAAIYSPKTSKVLFRYRLPEWEFADSSLVAGEGPDDLTQAYLFASNRLGNVLWLSEPNRQKFSQYDLSLPMVHKTKSVPGTSNDWIFNGTVCDDTLLVYGNLNFDDGEYYLYTARLADSLQKLDTLRCFSKSEIKVTNINGGVSKYATTRNVPSVKINGDRLAAWYSETGSMLIYRVEPGGSLLLEKSFGEPLTYEKVKNIDFKNRKRDYTENLGGVSDGYIYLIRTQYDRVPDESPNPDNPRKVVALEVKIYDWDMNPVKKYGLDKKEASRLFIDEANGKIYAYDQRLDFEQVYTYDYKL